MISAINHQLLTWVSHGITFEIRRANAKDAEAVSDLVNAAYSENDYGYYRVNEGKGDGRRTNIEHVTEKITQRDKFTLYVCVKKKDPLDQIVGTIYLTHQINGHPHKGEACMFAIQSEYRRHYEIGSRLLQLVEKEAQTHKLTVLALDIVDAIGEHNQQHLISYYQKNGYTVTDEKEVIMVHGFKQPVTLLKMQKLLKNFSFIS